MKKDLNHIVPKYCVINEQGETLLVGVSHSYACRKIDERQAFPEAYPQWQGDMRIRSERLSICPRRAAPMVAA